MGIHCVYYWVLLITWHNISGWLVTDPFGYIMVTLQRYPCVASLGLIISSTCGLAFPFSFWNCSRSDDANMWGSLSMKALCKLHLNMALNQETDNIAIATDCTANWTKSATGGFEPIYRAVKWIQNTTTCAVSWST